MLGRVMSESLKKKPGDTVELSGSRYRVVGIYESGNGWEEIGGVLTLRDGQALAGRPRKVTMFGVKVQDPDQAPAIVEKINSRIPEVHAALSGEFVEQMPDMQNANGMLDGISVLAIMVGGVGVLNTMLMAVFERTREIGVLRALGWRRLSVLGLVLQEALYLGLLGGITGIGIAVGLVYLAGKIPMIGEAFQAEFTWVGFARAILVALSLGVMGGLYPAYRATRLQPVEALHYE
jgi:putative ABC transport system permease protein